MIIENNFLTEEELNVTQEQIINNMDFPWYRVPHSTSEKYPFYAHTLLARAECGDDEQYYTDSYKNINCTKAITK